MKSPHRLAKVWLIALASLFWIGAAESNAIKLSPTESERFRDLLAQVQSDQVEPEKPGRHTLAPTARFLIVNEKGEIDKYHGDLLANLRARNLDEVTAIAWIRMEAKEVARYSNGGTASIGTAHFVVIDPKTGSTIGRKSFSGAPPPNSIRVTQGFKGGHTTHPETLEINQWFRSLRRPWIRPSIVVWGDVHTSVIDFPPTIHAYKAVAAGESYAVAITAERGVVSWGSNAAEQALPLDLGEVSAIDAAGEITVALKNDGTIAMWGPKYGVKRHHMLGTPEHVTAVAIGAELITLKADRTVAAWRRAPENLWVPSEVPSSLTDVIAIAAESHTVALRSNGTVVAWGDNSSGQTNVPAALKNVTAIAAGTRFTVALKSDGTVLAWGDNRMGQTKVPADLKNVIAIATGAGHSAALKSDGTVVAWGDNRKGQTNVPRGMRNVTAVSCGPNYTIALVDVNPLRTWTDRSGRTMEAYFLSRSPDGLSAHFQLHDGTESEVLMEKLSEADLSWINSIASK